MKPDWKDAPFGAEFLAMDGSGCWFWYASEPSWDASHHAWKGGQPIKFAGDSVPASNTLERRP